MSQIPESPGPVHDPVVAASKVKGPAVALIVVAVINVLIAIFQLVNNISTLTGQNPQVLEMEQQLQQVEGAQGIDTAFFMQIIQASGVAGVVFNILALIISAVIIYGAMKMMKLQSKGLATTASVLAMIPCLSPCCLLGLPIGIWSLIALKDPAVQAVYR